jgi:riboflavin kinase/FMN adenylyltransferase
LKVIHTAAELDAGNRPVCVAIGMFDGVHLGHQQVIHQTLSDAAQHEGVSVVVTFDRHPSTVVASDRVPSLIQTTAERMRTIAAMGVDAVLLLQFDAELSRLSARDFIGKKIAGMGHLRSVCVGADFGFGHQRSGNVTILRQIGSELGFSVHGLAAVQLDGQPVRSTRIREAIRCGDFDAASQMLGRNYSLVCPVVHGDHIGRTLGFPTANLDVAGLVLPPNGVYAVHARVEGRTHRSVMNLGLRPSLNQPRTVLRAEVHLLDFDGDLYGREMEVCYVRKLRDERKFETLDALREQIRRDVAQARQDDVWD